MTRLAATRRGARSPITNSNSQNQLCCCTSATTQPIFGLGAMTERSARMFSLGMAALRLAMAPEKQDASEH